MQVNSIEFVGYFCEICVCCFEKGVKPMKSVNAFARENCAKKVVMKIKRIPVSLRVF